MEVASGEGTRLSRGAAAFGQGGRHHTGLSFSALNKLRCSGQGSADALFMASLIFIL